MKYGEFFVLLNVVYNCFLSIATYNVEILNNNNFKLQSYSSVMGICGKVLVAGGL